MKNIIQKIRKIDGNLCEKHPAYERFVNLWGMEQKFDLWLSKTFPSTAKLFTDEIAIKRFSEPQKVELLKNLR